MKITKKKKENTGSPIKLGMTLGVLSRMTVGVPFEDDKKRQKKIEEWIPSQAGNDSYYGSSIKDFEDDSGGHSRESGNPEDRSLDPQSSWG